MLLMNQRNKKWPFAVFIWNYINLYTYDLHWWYFFWVHHDHVELDRSLMVDLDKLSAVDHSQFPMRAHIPRHDRSSDVVSDDIVFRELSMTLAPWQSLNFVVVFVLVVVVVVVELTRPWQPCENKKKINKCEESRG